MAEGCPDGPTGARPNWPARRMWTLLIALYVGLALMFSALVPAGRGPDELAHMQYIEFLAREHRLPEWTPYGAGKPATRPSIRLCTTG